MKHVFFLSRRTFLLVQQEHMSLCEKSRHAFLFTCLPAEQEDISSFPARRHVFLSRVYQFLGFPRIAANRRYSPLFAATRRYTHGYTHLGIMQGLGPPSQVPGRCPCPGPDPRLGPANTAAEMRPAVACSTSWTLQSL